MSIKENLNYQMEQYTNAVRQYQKCLCYMRSCILEAKNRRLYPLFQQRPADNRYYYLLKEATHWLTLANDWKELSNTHLERIRKLQKDNYYDRISNVA